MLALLVVAPSARAQDVADAAPSEPVVAPEAPPPTPSAVDLRLAQGEVLFDAGNYDAALAEFEEAYGELASDPERFLLLFNMGQCAERLFRYDEAIRYYQRYLDEGGAHAEGAADVAASIRALEGLLGTITITVNVARASVWVDGREVGTAPGELHVPGGPHTVELRASGHSSSAQQVTIAARGHVDLRIELAEISSFEGMDPIVFALTTTVTVAVLIAAVSAGISALVMHDREVARDTSMRSLADQRTIADTATVADALWLAGGTLAIASIALAALTDWDGHPSETHDTTVRLVPGVGSIVLDGTF